MTVTAVADEFSRFALWDGPNAAECASGRVTMDGNKACSAVFRIPGPANARLSCQDFVNRIRCTVSFDGPSTSIRWYIDDTLVSSANARSIDQPIPTHVNVGDIVTVSVQVCNILSPIHVSCADQLKLLDQRSKAADPSLFGDIAVKTRSEIIFQSTKEQNYLNIDLILKNGASVTYSPTQSAFSNESDKFTYVFASPVDEDIIKKEIDSLILVAEKKKEELKSETEIPFDFDFKIEVENEAKVIFVLSREFKQNLTAYLGGKVEYSEISGLPIAKGELKLLDGSKLGFIKIFQADGNIRFLDEIDNPYVDVTATYESFYSPDTVRNTTNEWYVRIIIKLEGPAKNIKI